MKTTFSTCVFGLAALLAGTAHAGDPPKSDAPPMKCERTRMAMAACPVPKPRAAGAERPANGSTSSTWTRTATSRRKK